MPTIIVPLLVNEPPPGNTVTLWGGSEAEKKWSGTAMLRTVEAIRKGKIDRMFSDPEYCARRLMKRDDGGGPFKGPKESMMTVAEAQELFADGDWDELSDATGGLCEDAGTGEEEDDGFLFKVDESLKTLSVTNGTSKHNSNVKSRGTERSTIITILDAATISSFNPVEIRELKSLQAEMMKNATAWASMYNLELTGSTEFIFSLKKKEEGFNNGSGGAAVVSLAGLEK